MRVLEGVKAEQIKEAANQTINAGSSVRTDGLNSCRSGLSGFEHDRMVLGSGPAASEKLPWVHILIANVKGMLRGVHHGVSPDHLQPYLSEFCWRFSRRHCQGELFDRLLRACITGGAPLTRAQLVGSSSTDPPAWAFPHVPLPDFDTMPAVKIALSLLCLTAR